MEPIADPVELDRLFEGYTQHAFIGELGIADPPLLDYVSRLLVRFVHRDQIFSMKAPSGRQYIAITDMLEEVERSEAVGTQRRELFRHIGDFALFWTGLFPEQVKRHQRWSSSELEEYTHQGKHSYYVASTYCDTPEQAQQSPVLRRLSDDFELCAVGLSRARRLWETDHPMNPGEPHST